MVGNDVLFRIKYRGQEVVVGHASQPELAAMARPVTTEARDILDHWSLVAIRSPKGGSGADIHALGWRRGLANVWITSVLMAVDLGNSAVSTTSGNAYTLGQQSPLELQSDLREHLRYALETWGFQDVRG